MVTRVQAPEIRKYKRKFNGEILCGALWGVNLLVGTDNGLLLLDRSGHGKGLCVREGGRGGMDVHCVCVCLCVFCMCVVEKWVSMFECIGSL